MFQCHFGWIWLSAPVGAAVWLLSEVISRRRAIYLVQRSSVILLFELSVCNCFSASPAVSFMKSCLLSLIAEWILHQGKRGKSVLYFSYFFLCKEPWEKFLTKKTLKLNWQFPFSAAIWQVREFFLYFSSERQLETEKEHSGYQSRSRSEGNELSHKQSLHSLKTNFTQNNHFKYFFTMFLYISLLGASLFNEVNK